MNAPSAPDEHPESHGDTNFRPDSASVIHAVVTRRNHGDAIRDRDTQQRERIERTNLGLLLHALHEIADTCIPPAQQRLVQESEVQRALAVLRRFALLNPTVPLEAVLTHCEEATARDRNPVAHLIDPFQLRHLLTFQAEVPPGLSSEELHALTHLAEHGPEAELLAWFARIGEGRAQLPKSAPIGLRPIVARACRSFLPAAQIELLAFETAVLTVRIQGVVGFEDTRLFFSLLKQIGGPAVPGLEGYLQSEEVNHATTQHRAIGNAALGDYFRSCAHAFDHYALPALEQRVFTTVEARDAPPPPPEPVAPEPPPPPEPRRGLFSGLRTIIARK